MTSQRCSRGERAEEWQEEIKEEHHLKQFLKQVLVRTGNDAEVLIGKDACAQGNTCLRDGVSQLQEVGRRVGAQ